MDTVDTTGSSSSVPSSVKRKNDMNWGGVREGSGRRKKTKNFTSVPQQPSGPSTQTLRFGNSRLAPPTSSQPAVAAVGFFAPRNTLASSPPSSVVNSNVNQADTDAGPQGARIPPERESRCSARTMTVPEYNQLERDLAYINDHEEFSDVAIGNGVIDDRLSNEIIEPTNEPATDAQAESEASEAREQ